MQATQFSATKKMNPSTLIQDTRNPSWAFPQTLLGRRWRRERPRSQLQHPKQCPEQVLDAEPAYATCGRRSVETTNCYRPGWQKRLTMTQCVKEKTHRCDALHQTLHCVLHQIVSRIRKPNACYSIQLRVPKVIRYWLVDVSWWRFVLHNQSTTKNKPPSG